MYDLCPGLRFIRRVRSGMFWLTLLEYLVKQWLQNSEPLHFDMSSTAFDAIQENMVTMTKYSNLKFIAELSHGVGSALSL